MIDYTQYPYFDFAENLANVLSTKTQSDNMGFFRNTVSYYMSKAASNMRVSIRTHDRGVIPVNTYVINLAPSGTGKGYSANIMEETIFKGFYKAFKEFVLPNEVDKSIAKLAVERSKKSGRDPAEEERLARAEYDRAGAFAFSFDSATTPAIKQLRHKFLMAGAGALSMEVDEIGSNLLNSVDALNTYLELYDIGKVKQKLTKNTNDSVRNEEIDGLTPANLMLMGTPAKLLDGGKNEAELLSLCETGFGRRCFFGFSEQTQRNLELSPLEIYLRETSKKTHTDLIQTAQHFTSLADPIYFGKVLEMSKDLAIELIAYRIYCEKLAEELPDHEQIRKAEISHRYFKAVKTAGSYAFSVKSNEILKEHLHGAIRVAEDSGKALEALLKRERNYVRLAKYILGFGREITNVDLVEDLQFFPSAAVKRNELMNLAITWAYKHNGVIKRSIIDGIEFYKGETLKRTDLSKLIISYSKDVVSNYIPRQTELAKLPVLFNANTQYEFCTHHFYQNYRKGENALPGFNLIVLDIDGGNTLQEARTFLKDYKYFIYTTKRHTDAKHRFRIVLIGSHELYLDEAEFKQFMDNVIEYLPFNPDTQTNQRCRKWTTYGNCEAKLEGELFPVMQFIPKTAKCEEMKAKLKDLSNLDNLERWFVNNTAEGSRNNQLYKYAAMLKDANATYEQIELKVKSLNSKLPDKLTEAELMQTVLLSIAKDIAKK